jgi:Ras-related protein Rab-1A
VRVYCLFRGLFSFFWRGTPHERHTIDAVVYDITSKSSFDNVKKWLDDVERQASSSAVTLLVGNKADLEHKRVVDFYTAKAYAEKLNMQYLETSAKENKNVEKAFEQLATQIMKFGDAPIKR